MSETNVERPAPADDVEIEELREDALEAVAGGLANPDSSDGPVCCSCSNCSPQ